MRIPNRLGKNRKGSRAGTRVNPYPAEIIYFNFHPPEVVVRYRDPQTSSGWKLLIFVELEHKYLQTLIFRHTFYSQ